MAGAPPPARLAPLVTVLIDNRDYERFLPAAVESALAQTWTGTEVLVVDDGSVDGSRDLLRGWGGRIRVHLQDNGGQAAAFNAALPLVRGELLITLDSDDTLHPDTVERVVRAFADHRGAARVQWRLDVVDAGGLRAGGVSPPRRSRLPDGDLRVVAAAHRGWRWPPTSGNAYDVALLRRLPPVPERTFRMNTDRWWCDLSTLLGPVVTLPGTGGTYRVHPGSERVRAARRDRRFSDLITRQELLHRAAREVAATAGLHGLPAHAADMVDPALASWTLAERKTTPRPLVPVAAARVRVAAAQLRTAAFAPHRSAVTRAAQTAWTAALLAVPSGSRPARMLVSWRYDRVQRP